MYRTCGAGATFAAEKKPNYRSMHRRIERRHQFHESVGV